MRAAPSSSGPKLLSAQEQRFVTEYLIHFNGTQAAIAAGYAKRSAHVTSSRLLKRAKVAEAIAAANERKLLRAEHSADKVLQELALIAFGDIRELYDDEGNPRPLSELSAEAARRIASIEVVEGGKRSWVRKVKTFDKIRALEALAKHHGLWREEVHHTGKVALEVIEAARGSLQKKLDLLAARSTPAPAQPGGAPS